MLCALILYVKGQGLQFNVDFQRQVFKKLFHGRFLFTLGVFSEICWEEVAEEVFLFSYYVWMSDLRYESNKPTQYLLDCSDIQISWHIFFKFSTYVRF